MATQNVNVMRRVVDEIWNRGALDVADELFAVDYINHGGLIPDVVCGPEAIKVSVALYRLAFPTFYVTVDEVTADGDTVVLCWRAHRARAETSESVTGRTRSRHVGGKIVESWTSWDRLRRAATAKHTPVQAGVAWSSHDAPTMMPDLNGPRSTRGGAGGPVLSGSAGGALRQQRPPEPHLRWNDRPGAGCIVTARAQAESTAALTCAQAAQARSLALPAIPHPREPA